MFECMCSERKLKLLRLGAWRLVPSLFPASPPASGVLFLVCCSFTEPNRGGARSLVTMRKQLIIIISEIAAVLGRTSQESRATSACSAAGAAGLRPIIRGGHEWGDHVTPPPPPQLQMGVPKALRLLSLLWLLLFPRLQLRARRASGRSGGLRGMEEERRHLLGFDSEVEALARAGWKKKSCALLCADLFPAFKPLLAPPPPPAWKPSHLEGC